VDVDRLSPVGQGLDEPVALAHEELVQLGLGPLDRDDGDAVPAVGWARERARRVTTGSHAHVIGFGGGAVATCRKGTPT